MSAVRPVLAVLAPMLVASLATLPAAEPQADVTAFSGPTPGTLRAITTPTVDISGDAALLDDGTFIATTYVRHGSGPEKHSVVSTRFALAETDTLARQHMQQQRRIGRPMALLASVRRAGRIMRSNRRS